MEKEYPGERCALRVAAFPEDRGLRVHGAATMWYLAGAASQPKPVRRARRVCVAAVLQGRPFV